MPAELDILKRRIMQLEIERSALEKEKDSLSKDRLASVNDELKDLKEEEKILTERWEKEKKELKAIKDVQKELEKARYDYDQALNKGNYDEAAKLQYSIIPSLESKIQEYETKVSNSGEKLLSEVVTEEDIASIVSQWTKIPVTKLVKGDKEKLIGLKETLARRVIGQDEAIQLVSDAIIRQRAGIKDENRPIGSFMFLGPTGVGKTEVSKSLAEALFDSENHIVRFDMSEYMEAHSVSRLVGLLGYIDMMRWAIDRSNCRQPYSIVLFDEIEKAHKDVFNILLQILDDGRLTDSQGRTVDFRNTLIIMTSNLGSEYLINRNDISDQQINLLLKKNFKPEFLNRIDEIIYFNALSKDVQAKIVNKMLNELAERLHEKKIEVKFTEKLKEHVLESSFNIDYGARPLKRFIQKNIETAIAHAIVNSEIGPHDHLIVDYQNEIIIKKNDSIK